MSFSPNDIPISITGSQTPVLHSEIPQGLSDYANPTVTDPKVAANFLFQNILLTNPGEKLSDPNFGVGLRSFLFEPQNSFYNLESIIGDQLSSYALGIQVLNVAVDLSGVDGNSVSVSIKYLNPNKTIEEYLLSADLGSQPSAVYV
jgi:phage baseplate assembly protein W|tara:strand:+ start:682 stop:1119 length:438 start_codon:yes stop_codon:yes gene_type:complete